MKFDTIVVGGGIVGAATAYALVKQGQHTLLVDQYAPANEQGSSHGDGRVIRFNYPEPIYVQLARLAYADWETLRVAAGKPLTQKTGIAECGPPDSIQIREQIANFVETGIPFEQLDGETYMQRHPQVQLPPDSTVLVQPDGGAVFAKLAVEALWEMTTTAGGQTISGQRVIRIDATDRDVRVHTAGQTWQAAKVVIAVGAWTNQLLSRLGLELPLEVTEEQLAYFAPKDNTDHRIGTINVLLDWHKAPPFYSIPQIEVPGLKVGWHHTGKRIDPNDNRADDPKLVDGIAVWVKERFPHLNPQPIKTVTCLYTNTPDHHFVLDKHPALPNIVIGTGFSGHGFKFGPTVGNILASLVLDQPAPLPLDTFSIDRFNQPGALTRRSGA